MPFPSPEPLSDYLTIAERFFIYWAVESVQGEIMEKEEFDKMELFDKMYEKWIWSDTAGEIESEDDELRDAFIGGIVAAYRNIARQIDATDTTNNIIVDELHKSADQIELLYSKYKTVDRLDKMVKEIELRKEYE